MNIIEYIKSNLNITKETLEKSEACSKCEHSTYLGTNALVDSNGNRIEYVCSKTKCLKK